MDPSEKGARAPGGPIAEPDRPAVVAPPTVGAPKAGPDQPPPASRASQGQQPRDRARDPGSGVKKTAQTAADALRQQASRFAADVGHELGKTGEVQKARGVDAMRSLARAIDSAAEELDEQSPTIARSVHEAAQGVKSLSDDLSNRNVNELIDSATQLARARPALFIGGSIAAGFALARFLKSSPQHRPTAEYDPYQR